MRASIHPLGERVRRNRWWLTAAAHVLASALAGALAGAVFGGVADLAPGRLLRGTSGLVLVIAVCGLAAAVDASGRGAPRPGDRPGAGGGVAGYPGGGDGGGGGVPLGLAG